MTEHLPIVRLSPGAFMNDYLNTSPSKTSTVPE